MSLQASFSRSYPRRLRVLSYNILSGIYTRHFGEYVTSSWKHVLPHRERVTNLDRIAGMLHGFDVVGLQEVDSGSLRSGFIDQTEYLAHRAHFPYWYKQVNRSLGKIAQHSNGMLSRFRPAQISEYKLPGLPGRGALLIEFDTTDAKTLGVCILHLALGRRARRRQLAFVTELISQFPYLLLMGDFNCDCSSREFQRLVDAVNLQGLDCGMKTFPSWRPRRNLDHILASSSLEVLEAAVVDYPLSDHLPVSMEVVLPWGVGVVT